MPFHMGALFGDPHAQQEQVGLFLLVLVLSTLNMLLVKMEWIQRHRYALSGCGGVRKIRGMEFESSDLDERVFKLNFQRVFESLPGKNGCGHLRKTLYLTSFPPRASSSKFLSGDSC